jgi:tRNA pseudouridine32 synthase / 23S rRNA pseudouridine746 synthase
MDSTSRAPDPSFVKLPPPGGAFPTVLDFLAARFPAIPRRTWEARIAAGRVFLRAGGAVHPGTPCEPGAEVGYFREVDREAPVPFDEQVLYADEHMVVACKPHFLPVTPSGPYVNECLLYRLRRRTGNAQLVPVHRLDRETAGLVLFSAAPQTRAQYCRLFARGRVRKHYRAVASPPSDPAATEWDVRSRIVKGEPWFRSRNADGVPNARTRIRLAAVADGCARFELEPLTGKNHQLRLHLGLIGSRIANDWLYPELQPEPKRGFECPLQLLACRLAFRDPVSNREVEFTSPRQLALWPEGSAG